MQRAHSGMKGFAVVWTGQFISLPGAAMTTFALTLRAYPRPWTAWQAICFR